MIAPNKKKQKYRQIAKERYMELIDILQTDKSIAKALHPFYGRTVSTIERNLSMLSFKNELSNIDFINAASQLLYKLENMSIEATVLFLSGEQVELIKITQNAKKLFNRGLNVIAPQSIITHQHEQFWDYVKADAIFADFLINKNLGRVLQ